MEDNTNIPDEEEKPLTGRDRSVANLKPVQKGEKGRNPWGRHGNPANRTKGRDAEFTLQGYKNFKDPLEFLTAVYVEDRAVLKIGDDVEVPLKDKIAAADKVSKLLYPSLKAKELDMDEDNKDKETQTVIVIPSNDRETKELIKDSKQALEDYDLKDAITIDLPTKEEDDEE